MNWYVFFGMMIFFAITRYLDKKIHSKIVAKSKEQGKAEAVEEIKKLYQENPDQGYRNAALNYMRVCAKCERTCIHCSRE